jgi:hypothetical protein
MENEILLKKVIRRLDILIALQIKAQGGAKASRTSTKIHMLSELGLSRSEVADIVAKSINCVTATLSKKKKGEKQRRPINDE